MIDIISLKKQLQTHIDHSTSITILSHMNPDADTLGTSLGIYALLKKHYHHKVEVVNVSKVLPRHLAFMPYFSKIKHQIEYEDSLVIVCDCANVERIGFELGYRDIINIDHHDSNTDFGTLNIVIPEYAASSQVAYLLFKDIYPMNAESATSFYAALLSDTLYFTTALVNSEVFEMAQEWIEQGANPHKIANKFTQEKSLSSLRILARAIDSLILVSDAEIGMMILSKDDIAATGATVADMEGIVDYAKSLVTVKIAILLIEMDGGIRVSLRSKGIDISGIAQEFGGGGHKYAAGFTCKQYDLQRSMDIILQSVKLCYLTYKNDRLGK